MDERFTILYVDDELGNLNAFKNTFRREYRILLADTPSTGLEILKNEHVDLILSDQRMPEMSGVEFLQESKNIRPETCRILVTAYSDFEAIQDAINSASIYKFVKKPWEPNKFKSVIDQALDISELRRKNKKLTTELQQKNAELEKANQVLAEADKLKFDFLKIIAHEMRTPLNGLKGATQLFAISTERNADPGQQKLLEVLLGSTTRLEQFLLIAERITTLQAGQYSLMLNRFSVTELVQAACEELDEFLQETQHTIEVEIGDQLAEIEADSELLIICIRELIHNAAKHTPPKSKIRIRTESSGDKLLLEVTDNGPGFPELVLRNLFHIFVKEDTGHDRTLGLNLALTKLVMDLHGGEVDAENLHNGGACVRLALPLPALAQATA